MIKRHTSSSWLIESHPKVLFGELRSIINSNVHDRDDYRFDQLIDLIAFARTRYPEMYEDSWKHYLSELYIDVGQSHEMSSFMGFYHMSELIPEAMWSVFLPVKEWDYIVDVASLARSSKLSKIARLHLSTTRACRTKVKSFLCSSELASVNELILRECYFDSEDLREVLEVLACNDLKKLDLKENKLSKNDAGILASSCRLKSIEELDVSSNAIGDAGLILLARSPYLTHMKSLNVEQCFLGDEGVLELSRSSLMSSLRSLNIKDNHCTDRALQELYLSRNTQLSYLDIGSHYRAPQFSPGGLRHVVSSAQSNCLEELRVDGVPLGGDGIREIGNGKQLSRLKKVSIRGCSLDESDVHAMARSSLFSKLETICLSNNKIGDRGVRILFDAVVSENTSSLHIENNGITSGGLSYVASKERFSFLSDLNLSYNYGDGLLEAISTPNCSTRIERLDFSECNVSDDDLIALARSRSYRNLRVLRLDSNDISDQGLIELANSSNLPNLEVLELRYNNITCVGVRALAESTNYPKLKEVDLLGNQISDEGIESILMSKTLAGLRFVDVRDNDFTDKGLADLSSVEMFKQSLLVLLLEDDMSNDAARDVEMKARFPLISSLRVSNPDDYLTLRGCLSRSQW